MSCFREPHYKYRFKKWRIERRLNKQKKTKIVRMLEQKKIYGGNPVLIHLGRPIDMQNIRRHAKQLIKPDPHLQLQTPSPAVSNRISVLPLPFKNTM
jgi:hypothetical protein